MAVACSAPAASAAPAGPAEPVRSAPAQETVDTATVLANFGFPMTFAPAKMDPTVDPRQDFYRYAAGRWLAAAQIPADSTAISEFHILLRQIDHDLLTILEAATAKAGAAPKGSPLQQVGDFYAAGMDVDRLRKLGVAPLRSELERIDAIDSPQALARELAHLAELTDERILFGAGVSTDTQDRTRYAIYFGDADLTLKSTDLYLKPEYAKQRAAYRKFVAEMLATAGTEAKQAEDDAGTILDLEIRIAGRKLTPLEAKDPAKRFVKMPYAKLRELLSNVDLDAYFGALELPTGGDVIVVEVDALRERNALVASRPMRDTRLLARWSLLMKMAAALTPALDEPMARLNLALLGQAAQPPRAQRVTNTLRTRFAHPLSRLYVEQHFSADSKRAVQQLIGQIRAEFRERLERNDWLSDKTRLYAIEKLDKAKISVGYPEHWIDYSGVDIRRDDYFGNVARTNAFSFRRALARLGQPVQQDEFAVPGSTTPIDVNAAFNPGANGIEIPAAFLQPPFYDPRTDAAVNYCTIGAVIGHELTHGFDSQGRLYDADGNVRNWWGDADAKHFVAEAGKLAKQADAFELLPGLHLNGPLTVTENLADVGGVGFAYASLEKYLAAHPAERKRIDGLTPEQRCFVSWAQLWATKDREGYLRQVTATDSHSNGAYRVFAPSQHVPEFFTTFGIQPGDPMWLDPKDRLHIW